MPPMTSCIRSVVGSALLWLLTVSLSLAAQSPPAPAETTTFLEGRVVDLRGEGVPVAKVWVVDLFEPDQVLARTVADGEGYFRLGKVPKRASLRTQGTADGYCVGIGESTGSITTIGLQQSARVSGVLRNKAGQPVRGALVLAQVSGRILWGVNSRAETDAEGRFVLPDVALAPNRISAWVEGEGVASVDRHVSGDGEIELRPGDQPVTTITIEVDGMPEAARRELRLSLLSVGGDSFEYLPPPFDLPSLPDGWLQLNPVPDVRYRVSPIAPGWVFAPRATQLQPDNGPHLVKFTATPVGAQTLAFPIEVRNTDGQPLAGVTITVRASSGGLQSQATTDAEGKASVDSPLAAGAKAILFSVDDRWVTDQATGDKPMAQVDKRSLGEHDFVVAPGACLQVKMVAACSVHGRLLRADGRPAAFVPLELQEYSSNRVPAYMAMSYATTDRDGGFVFPRLHHLEAILRLSVQSTLGSWTSDALELNQPGTELKLPEAKLAEPASIAGVLRDGEQRPVAGMRVWLREWERNSSVVETFTDRDGRYRFLGVSPGRAYLELLAGVGATVPNQRAVDPFEVEPGQAYMVDLEVPAK